MSTPRPSISPLSNAHESIKGSPSLLRQGAMAETEINEDRDHAAVLDEEKDDSSLLSEPEDDDREEEEILQSIGITHSAARKDDVDSEAETERLELTPKHARELADAGIGRTPSKLSKVEQHDDELSEPPSPLPHDVGAASSTSTGGNGKKRKRSDELESPLSSEASIDGESPRKRKNSFKEHNATGENSREETTDVVEDNAKSTKMRKSTSRRGTRAGREAIEARDTIEAEDAPEPEPEETAEAHVDEDPVQKTEATDAFTQLAKQFTAFRDALYNERLGSIEKELALLEQPDCQHPEYLRMVACVQQRRTKQDRETKAYNHYRQVATQQKVLAERSQLHSQYFQTIREIREEALDRLGTSWCGIQRERRQGVGAGTDEDYRHVYRYVNKRSDLLRQQAKYNREVSILSGIAKHVGFPAAPDITGVEGDALEDDLKAMKLARPVQHTNRQQSIRQAQPYPQNATPQVVNQYRPDVSAASAERSAHERFIEQHAWARAPQSTYASVTNTPIISHTPGWAEHTTGFRKSTFPRPQLDQSPAERITPSGTPISGRPMHQDVPDSTEQAPRDYVPPGSSPLQVPKQRLNGAESNGWRNYSGTSTIDAPLGDTGREHEAYEAEQNHKRDFAREQSDARSNLPLMESTTQPYEPRAPIPASIFPTEKTEMYRTAGFRPLDDSFAAQSSVPGRS